MIPDPVPDVAGRDLVEVEVEVDDRRAENGILRAQVASLKLHRTILRRRIERLQEDRVELLDLLEDETVAPLKRLGAAQAWLRTDIRETNNAHRL